MKALFMEKELRIGDNIKVISVGGNFKFQTITGIDDMYYKDAHSALAAGSTDTFAEVTELDPPSGQLYLVRSVETECNIEISLKQPASTNRLGTNKSPDGGLLTSKTASLMGIRDINFWLVENYAPNVQIVNNTNVSITPILWWIGKRYSTVEIDKPAVYSTIKIGGISD